MQIEIKRLDHHGIVSGVIKELGLTEEVDERIREDVNGLEGITPIKFHRSSR